MRFFPSLTGAVATACVLLGSTLPALSEQTKPTPKWDPTKVNHHVSLGSRAATQALSYRGVPYHFGGQSRKGIDCSALIQSAYKQWGIWLPRTSVEQYKKGVAVPRDHMKPGDLVFFKNTYKRGVSHVGIYLGNNRFCHASSGRKQVTVSSLNDAYYYNHWAGARRIALDKEPVYPDEDRGDEAITTQALSVKDGKEPDDPKATVATDVPALETETTSTRGNRP